MAAVKVLEAPEASRFRRKAARLAAGRRLRRLPSFAFFRRAKVPPSFPKKESSFFREDGDLGVGDLGEEGDF